MIYRSQDPREPVKTVSPADSRILKAWLKSLGCSRKPILKACTVHTFFPQFLTFCGGGHIVYSDTDQKLSSDFTHPSTCHVDMYGQVQDRSIT